MPIKEPSSLSSKSEEVVDDEEIEEDRDGALLIVDEVDPVPMSGWKPLGRSMRFLNESE